MKSKTIVIALLLTWSLLPMLWQIITSFSTDAALVDPFVSLSHRWTLNNYIQVLNSDPPFWRYLSNSTFVAGVSTILTLVLAIPASYGLSRLSKRTKNVSRIIIAILALFPYVLLFLSLLEIARYLGLGNNLLSLSLPYAGLSMPLALLLLTAAFDGLPKDIDHAARLEGLGPFQRMRWVLIPLITPATASTAILVFLFCFNEYPIALTWISKTELLTLPVAIARLAGSSIYTIPYGAYAASTVLGAIPLLIIVLFFQRQIITGLTNGAIKG